MSIAGIIIDWAAAELLPLVLAEASSRAWQRVADGGRSTDDSTTAREDQPIPVLRLVTEMTVISATPGRVRFHLVGLQHNTTAAEIVERRLQQLPGIGQVRASALTGKVLVEYDEDQSSLEQIRGAITRLRHPHTSRLQARSVRRAPALKLVGKMVGA